MLFKVKDLTDYDNGYIKVLEFQEIRRLNNNKTRSFWKCLCKCSAIIYLSSDQIKTCSPRSCGCYKQKREGNKNYHAYHTTHGLSKGKTRHPLLRMWKNIKQRCYKKNNKSYKNYGAKGIKLCNEWYDVKKFYEWCINNGWNKGLTIDRIDSNKNYEPSNCQFLTPSENSKKVFVENPFLNKGSNHKDAILNEEKVLEIKKRIKNGERNYEIAKFYEIKQNIVYQIKKNKTWKHVLF